MKLINPTVDWVGGLTTQRTISRYFKNNNLTEMYPKIKRTAKMYKLEFFSSSHIANNIDIVILNYYVCNRIKEINNYVHSLEAKIFNIKEL